MNDSGIRPLEYQVLVKPIEVEEKTSGGLYLPDDKKERDQYAQVRGTLIALSPLAFSYDDRAVKTAPKVGATVFFPKYQATEVQGQNGETYWLMQDKSIIAEMMDNGE